MDPNQQQQGGAPKQDYLDKGTLSVPRLRLSPTEFRPSMPHKHSITLSNYRPTIYLRNLSR